MKSLPVVLVSLAVMGFAAACGGSTPDTSTTPDDCVMPTARRSGMPSARPSDGPGIRTGGVRPSGGPRACGSVRPDDGRNAAYLDCLSQFGVTPSPGQALPSAAAACEVLRPSRVAR